MAIPATNFIANGVTYPLAGGSGSPVPSTEVPALVSGNLVVTGVPEGGVVNVFDFSGPTPLALAYGVTSPFSVPYTAPASGSHIIGVQAWSKKQPLKRQQVGETGKYKITAAASTPDGVGDPVITTPPKDEAETPSHILKGLCVDELLPFATPVRRLDGTMTTTGAMHRDVWGTRFVRLYMNVAAGGTPDAKAVTKAIAWAKEHAIGRIVFCCTPADGGAIKPTAKQTTAWFVAFGKLIVGRGLVIHVELVNEPNLPKYWRYSTAELVALFITPAAVALAAAGVATIGASPTGNVQTVIDLRKAGMKTGSQGFHFYRKTAGDLRAMIEQLVAVIGNTPIDITEFNAYLGMHLRAWLVLQAHPELIAKASAAGRKVTDADVQAIDARALLPALSPDDIIEIQQASWAELVKTPSVRLVAYYIMFVAKETSTGPLALLKLGAGGVLVETVFSRDFWAVVK